MPPTSTLQVYKSGFQILPIWESSNPEVPYVMEIFIIVLAENRILLQKKVREG